MIKRYRLLFTYLFFISITLLFNACEKKDPTKPVKLHWDRDMCERCKMAVSERKYAVQVTNPATGKHYFFDDIGCAILWFDEEHIEWKDKAIIWITDAKNGKWIDARKALYTDDSITPMAYGISAFTKETFPKDKKPLDFNESCKIIKRIEELHNAKVFKK